MHMRCREFIAAFRADFNRFLVCGAVNRDALTQFYSSSFQAASCDHTVVLHARYLSDFVIIVINTKICVIYHRLRAIRHGLRAIRHS